ncbi:MAG: hypothetical protein JSS64_02120 [Bacteroidetes bacterium]|nr:hypothetical protein [Bacteroidota bacterium]
MYIPDINTLIHLTPTVAEEYVVAGFYSPGDGGGGTFIWEPINPPGSITPPKEDKGIVFYLNGDKLGSLGYFKRIYSGPINVRWFGAIMGATDPNPPIDPHTGSAYTQPIADVTPYFQRAADSPAAEEGTIYIPAGEYYGHLEITTNNKVSVLGDGQGTIIHGAPELSDGSTSYKEVILVKRHWGVIVRISNIQIRAPLKTKINNTLYYTVSVLC